MILGITGQTGAGKTTVLEVVEMLGGFVIDCDALYWKLLQENQALVAALTHEFHDISDHLGSIDRKKLGAQVFGFPEKLEQLNAITHPYVIEKVMALVEDAKKKGYTIIAVDGITLIESGLHHKCDKVISVVAEQETRVSRIMERDGITQEYALNRVNAQQNETFYKENSDFVLENNSSDRDVFLEYAKLQIQTINL